ncbi:MAG: hypothetical protein EFT35_03350 [Methanophagales archaeon ANME-1-THS]|nr:MAG: hypothetical protein EFT35_03350 [Methanophagales archaeon ANME-1-THS]
MTEVQVLTSPGSASSAVTLNRSSLMTNSQPLRREKLFIAGVLIELVVVEMAELKIKIPKELEEEMEQFPGVEWQIAVRKLLKEELGRMRELKAIVAKSKLTEKDIEELSDSVDESLAWRFRQSLKK